MATENIQHHGENTHEGDRLIAPEVFSILLKSPWRYQQLNKQLFLTRAHESQPSQHHVPQSCGFELPETQPK